MSTSLANESLPLVAQRSTADDRILVEETLSFRGTGFERTAVHRSPRQARGYIYDTEAQALTSPSLYHPFDAGGGVPDSQSAHSQDSFVLVAATQTQTYDESPQFSTYSSISDTVIPESQLSSTQDSCNLVPATQSQSAPYRTISSAGYEGSDGTDVNAGPNAEWLHGTCSPAPETRPVLAIRSNAVSQYISTPPLSPCIEAPLRLKHHERQQLSSKRRRPLAEASVYKSSSIPHASYPSQTRAPHLLSPDLTSTSGRSGTPSSSAISRRTTPHSSSTQSSTLTLSHPAAPVKPPRNKHSKRHITPPADIPTPSIYSPDEAAYPTGSTPQEQLLMEGRRQRWERMFPGGLPARNNYGQYPDGLRRDLRDFGRADFAWERESYRRECFGPLSRDEERAYQEAKRERGAYTRETARRLGTELAQAREKAARQLEEEKMRKRESKRAKKADKEQEDLEIRALLQESKRKMEVERAARRPAWEKWELASRSHHS